MRETWRLASEGAGHTTHTCSTNETSKWLTNSLTARETSEKSSQHEEIKHRRQQMKIRSTHEWLKKNKTPEQPKAPDKREMKTHGTRATENAQYLSNSKRLAHERLKTLDTRATENARLMSNQKHLTHEQKKMLDTRETKTHDTRAAENAQHTSNWKRSTYEKRKDTNWKCSP